MVVFLLLVFSALRQARDRLASGRAGIHAAIADRNQIKLDPSIRWDDGEVVWEVGANIRARRVPSVAGFRPRAYAGRGRTQQPACSLRHLRLGEPPLRWLQQKELDMARKRKNSVAADVVRLGMLVPLVVGQRLTRMAAAAPDSHRTDAAEWQRMTSEKWFAAQESWFAAAIAWQQQLLEAGMRAWSPWSRVSPLDWWKQRQVDAQNVGAAALTPVVRRVAGNARRLSRRS